MLVVVVVVTHAHRLVRLLLTWFMQQPIIQTRGRHDSAINLASITPRWLGGKGADF